MGYRWKSHLETGTSTLVLKTGNHFAMRIPLISEIQRFSLQDGPGIRTTLFVKGCPLHCPWCHNPESQAPGSALFYHASRCTNCLSCAEVCPSGASHAVVKPGHLKHMVFDRESCLRCMECVSVCLSGTREIVGKVIFMDEILRELTSDKPFFDSSGGGVTISGGEPLMFAEFTRTVGAALKKEGIHVAVETCACVEGRPPSDLADTLDLFIVDLKTLDTKRHQDVVGGSLTLVLNNIAGLIDKGVPFRIHIPVIPGFNDSPDEYTRFADYLGKIAPHVSGVDILPYHCYGGPKYAALGRSMDADYCPAQDMPSKRVMPLVSLLKSQGVVGVTVGGMVGVKKEKDLSG